jgi:predicted aspartyl protease
MKAREGVVYGGLGIAAQERDQFVLADGRRVERDVASCLVRLNGRVRSTVCVIDDGAPETRLGAVTLEEFGLAVDPVNRRLVKAEKYLV